MHHKPFRRLFCLVLLLTFVCGLASAADFSFRGGITWSTAPEQMLTAEGVTGDGYTEKQVGSYWFYYIKGKDAYYVYRDQQLLQAYTVQPVDAYAGLLEAQTAQFGTPAEVSAEVISVLVNRINGDGTLLPQELASLAAWRLSDGTLAALFMLGGKTYMTYFNEQAIAGGA